MHYARGYCVWRQRSLRYAGVYIYRNVSGVDCGMHRVSTNYYSEHIMATREDMKDWVLKALMSRGGKGWPKDVAKYIWENYQGELNNSGDLLYTWQYDVRWAAQSLRNAGKLKPVHRRRDRPWELA